MACMEHVCTTPECEQDLIFNNQSNMECPKCGEPMSGFFDEEPEYDGRQWENEDYHEQHDYPW